jgi:hypothetical protein
MNAAKSIKTVGVLAGALVTVALCLGAPAPKLSGSIAGIVRDGAGVPQMGAAVVLCNRYDRLLERVLTSDQGIFGFHALAPGVYNIRVTLSSFLPALKRDIAIQPGMQSLLSVNLASVFSSVELVDTMPGDNPIMSDEWKWVLRGSSQTRPILRLAPDTGLGERAPRESAALFSGTTGVVRLSAGDAAASTSLGSDPDVGTAFAVRTSFLGTNDLQLSGNVAYSSYSGAPITGISTSLRRAWAGGDPEIKVTMRQICVANEGVPLGETGNQAPALRTLSATVSDETRLTSRLLIEYGFSRDSVSFLDQFSYYSPYGRLSYEGAPGEVVAVAYSSGNPPTDLFARSAESGAELQRDLATLTLFPMISLRDGETRVQRTDTMEAGYRKTVGSRTYAVAVYRDEVLNAALSIAGADGLDVASELLPEMFANGSIFNAGNFQTFGFLGSVEQNLGERFTVSVAFESGNVLTADPAGSELTTAEDLRNAIHAVQREALTTRLSGVMPKTGTRFAASYQWASATPLSPAHLYLTESFSNGPGLNIHLRQPIPYFGGLPGHVEATANLENILAQGYIPVNFEGRRVYLLQSPRAVRGGLNFVF